MSDPYSDYAQESLRDTFGLSKAANYRSSWEVMPIKGKYDAKFEGVLAEKVIKGPSDKVSVMMAFEHYSYDKSLSARIKVWLPMATFEHVWQLCETTLTSSDTILALTCELYVQQQLWDDLKGKPRGHVIGLGAFSIVAAPKPKASDPPEAT